MVNSVRNDFHSDLALSIANEIQFQKSNYYYFLGKVESWGVADKSPLGLQADSDQENNLIRSNAIFIKKITSNDVSIVTTRYDWKAGTVFAIWDHTKNMSSSNFYCVTDDSNVYKCLDNKAGSPSTVKPTEKSFGVFRTSDGYLWKYMYNIPSFKRSRFTSIEKIPVQRALSNSFYNKGSVDQVLVAEGGTGYNDVALTTVTVTGATTGTGATGTINVNPSGGIVSVTLTSGGTGYTKGVSISFTSATGTGGVGTATIVGGVITGIVINSPGVNYVQGQSVVFSVGGGVFSVGVSRVTGSIEKVVIVNPGKGYTVAPTLTVVAASGTGKFGNTKAILEAVEFGGSVVIVNIKDPGINYPSPTTTTITAFGDGTGASFTPVVSGGKVIDVITENAGSGYTSLTLNVVGTGTGAKLTSIISSSDFTSDQSTIEQTTLEGAIYSIVVTSGGNNYSPSTQISIIGDGMGATGTPTIVNGAITGITVTNYGVNYTYATIVFLDASRGIMGPVVDATAYATLPPIGGHGINAVTELFGKTLAINSSLRQDGKLTGILQDYRQFGLIKNPTSITTGKLITENSSLLTHECLFTDVTGLILDEVLILGTVKYRVIFIDGLRVTLQQLGINYLDPVGALFAEKEPSRAYTSSFVTSYPTANKYSGSLLYVSNENPFSFTAEQGITIKTFLTF